MFLSPVSTQPTPFARHALPLAFIAAVAALDLVAPNGLAIPVLYVAVLPTLLHWRTRYIVATASGLTVLTLAGAFVGPSLLPLRAVLVNRAVAVVAIWIATMLLTYHKGREACAAAERARASDMIRLLLDAAPDGMLLVGRAGQITYANAALEKMLGYAHGALLGRPIEVLVPESHRDAHAQQRVAWLSAAKPRTMAQGHETSARRRDGTLVPIEAMLSILDNGMPLVTVRDVKERRALEERIRATQRMEAIGRLAGGVAHDFNNLLSVIGSYGTFALDALEHDHPARSEVAEMLVAAERATALTSQLLAFSRRQVISPRLVDVTTIVAAVERMLGRLLGDDIELSTTSEPGVWLTELDPSQLEQVLLNLAVNARDAMPRGGKLSIEVTNASLDEDYARQHPEVEPGDYVRLSITDSGQGMTEEVRVRVFEPFFTTKAVGKGTGLGLATVYGIVKQARGHIWVYSEVGKGTTFKIYLPRCRGEAAPRSVRPSAPPRRGGTETILVVEDQVGVRSVTARILRAEGYSVLEATNGADALLKCRTCEGAIHLVLTDVMMPQMGGRELADALAKQWPAIRVVFMSGYTEKAIVHHGVLDPGLVFLQKPFAREALLSRVREVLDA